MCGCSNLPRLIGDQGEYSQRNADGFGTDAVQPTMTRVQIEALVSGEFTPLRLAPDLVFRLNRAWGGAGQRLHMLQVEVVHAPVNCPQCGERALYRRERRGFLQRRVFPRLGFYPWHCISCRKSTLLRLRSNQEEIAAFEPPDFGQTRKAA